VPGCFTTELGELTVSQSVLDAIRDGMWDYEPPQMTPEDYSSTKAMPGTKEKIATLAERAEMGLPLWHDYDRLEYDEDDRA
jgi:hypothetical protein